MIKLKHIKSSIKKKLINNNTTFFNKITVNTNINADMYIIQNKIHQKQKIKLKYIIK